MFSVMKWDTADIGLSYVLGLVNVVSPFGRDALRALRPYKQKDRAELIAELNNIKTMLTLLSGESVKSLKNSFAMLRDVRGTIRMLGKRALSDVELFELKCMLIIQQSVFDAYDRLAMEYSISGISFYRTEAALSILDPNGKRDMTFYISDTYSEKLKTIREQKKQLEAELYLCSENNCNDNQRDLLLSRRRACAEKEAEEEYEIRLRLTKELLPFQAELLFCCENLGKLDLLIAKAELARSAKAVMPEIADDSFVSFENVINPYVQSLLNKKGRSFKPVSIELDKGTSIITGANMGGKSVALKTFLLNVMLAQLGFFVFAEKAKLCLFDNIDFILYDGQDIGKGLSTFGGQMLGLNRLTASLKNGRAFFVIDELAGGTNPIEGRMIFKSAARYFNSRDCVALMTTHFDGVIQKECKHYQVKGLAVNSENLEALKGKIKSEPEESVAMIADLMDYSLIRSDGKDAPKDAFTICKLLGVEEEIYRQR